MILTTIGIGIVTFMLIDRVIISECCPPGIFRLRPEGRYRYDPIFREIIDLGTPKENIE